MIQHLVFPANPQVQAFYGGRMTEDRLLAVKNATCEAIDHLHKSLESCPSTEAEAPDPKGIKVRHYLSQYILSALTEIYDTPVGILTSLHGCIVFPNISK